MRNTLVELKTLLGGKSKTYESGRVVSTSFGKATVRLESGQLREVYGSVSMGEYLLISANQIVATLEQDSTATVYVE